MEKHAEGNSQFAQYPSLRGRGVLVTGGATGIGESLVTHFARQGSRVAFLDIQEEPGRRLVESLRAEGCPAPLYLHCELTDIEALQSAVKHALDALGGIDVLVNNAANDQRHTIEEVTPAYLGSLHRREFAPAVFCDSGCAPGHARGAARLHH